MAALGVAELPAAISDCASRPCTRGVVTSPTFGVLRSSREPAVGVCRVDESAGVAMDDAAFSRALGATLAVASCSPIVLDNPSSPSVATVSFDASCFDGAEETL